MIDMGTSPHYLCLRSSCHMGWLNGPKFRHFLSKRCCCRRRNSRTAAGYHSFSCGRATGGRRGDPVVGFLRENQTKKPEWATYNTTGGPSVGRLEELQARSPTWVCFICSFMGGGGVGFVPFVKKKLDVRTSVQCSYIQWRATTAELR
jgi:hypothetical protein